MKLLIPTAESDSGLSIEYIQSIHITVHMQCKFLPHVSTKIFFQNGERIPSAVVRIKIQDTLTFFQKN
jgi:hypothetical protein